MARADAADAELDGEPAFDLTFGRRVRRLRIAGWTSFSAGWVFFGLGFVFLDSGSMDESPWLLRIASFDSAAFVLLVTGGALLLRARLMVWRHSAARGPDVSVSASGLQATWSF